MNGRNSSIVCLSNWMDSMTNYDDWFGDRRIPARSDVNV